MISMDLANLQIPLPKKVITCLPDTSIQTAAQLMNTHQIGSLVVVDEAQKPLGIITDTDFRKKVARSPQIQMSDAVSKVMSSPVITIQPDRSLAEIMLKMTQHYITHLCITESGYPDSAVLGVISQRDVLIAQGNHPIALLKQILNSSSVLELKMLREKVDELIKIWIHQEMSIVFISKLITQINDTLLNQALKIAQKTLNEQGIEVSPLSFCWLALGSEGRSEQILRTDQDNAIVYANPPDAQSKQIAQNYFLALGKVTCEILAECGFELCPANIMASQAKWCRSLDEYENTLQKYNAEPDQEAILYASIFFDFRPIAGETNLAVQLKKFIFLEIGKNDFFLSFLAKNALQNPPPLSFFNQFKVEKSGKNKQKFDLKARAMMPLVDAARVLAYDFRLENYGSTSERLTKIAELDQNLKDICEAAAMAYEILLKLKTRFGLKNQDSGRFINPNDFNKLERQIVKNIFKTIDKIQQTFSIRYQLHNLR